MSDQGAGSDDLMYVNFEIVVPARGGRTYQYRPENAPVRSLWSTWLPDEVESWLEAVRRDLELGDRS